MAVRKQAPTSVYQLKVAIRHIRPPVWRRLHVPDGITLAALHQVLQTAMGWEDDHLHEFVVGETRYGPPDPDAGDWGQEFVDERLAALKDVVGGGLKKFVYEYDFGDGWEHAITVEKVLAAEAGVAYPRCVGGKRACPPEDCGGPWGYKEFLKTVGDPGHPRHAELSEWIGGEFDPEAFDLAAVNAQLQIVIGVIGDRPQ